MTVWSEEGHLYYKSPTNDPTVCGIYIIAKPEQTVHVYFDYVDVPCNTGGLIAVSARQPMTYNGVYNNNDYPLRILVYTVRVICIPEYAWRKMCVHVYYYILCCLCKLHYLRQIR